MAKIIKKSEDYNKGWDTGFQAGLRKARDHDAYKVGRREGYGDLKHKIKKYLSGEGTEIKWLADLLNVGVKKGSDNGN